MPSRLDFVAKLVALAFENVALALVLFDAFVEVVERFERAFFERPKIGESFELVVDLAAFDPQRLDVDRDFQPPGAGGDRLWPRPGGASTSSASSRSFTADCAQRRPLVTSSSSSPCSCSCARDERAKLRFLFARVEQPQPRAFEHVDHVVERDAIQAGREPVQPLGGGRVAERVELLHFAEADGEDVDVRRLVDVLERFAQQAVALLFAVGGDDRDFADVGRPAVGVAADRERAVVGFDFEPAAGPAADDRRQVPLAARAATRRTAPTA